MATKVLVFESDPAFAGELRNELGKLGCATTVVDDGNVGLQQAASERPDLILLSIELPRMNGFSVCNKLKKDAGLKDVPLIIMSSESSDETFEQHKKLRTRAEDYVHKPIAFGELLQHIQGFVNLAPAAAGEGDNAIVIDDEIEIGSTDYLEEDEGTQIASRPPHMQDIAAASATKRGMEPVDADVDAFADAAFGRLTGADAPGAVAEARPMAERVPMPQNGAPESVTSPAAPARRQSEAPARRPSVAPMRASKPPASVDLQEYERLRVELESQRARLMDTERALTDARNEADKLRIDAGETERLQKEVDELKAKLLSGAKTSGISSREFLDLREGLNKKDKEILSLKEQLTKKDRDSVEAQDRALALERAKADIEDKQLGLERELAELREKTETLGLDKDTAKKAAEDFKARFEKARHEIETKERQLVESRGKHVEEMATAEAKLAAARADLDQTLANERAEHARAVDLVEQRRKADLEQARTDREGALAELLEQADHEKQEELTALAEKLRQENDGKMAALHRAHQQEIERQKNEAAQAISTMTQEARAETERKAEATLAQVRGEYEEKIKGIENDRDSRVAATEAKASRELGEVHEQLAKLDMDLSATRGELASLREDKEKADAEAAAKIADLEKSLAEVRSAREELDRKATAAETRVAVLEGEVASVRQELAETKQKLAAESSRADKANAKWESDRQSLERAKDALAVALQQIEDAEGRPIS
ncbi:MAG TPA: response regulator [Polyangiaceae bacterium]|nr:response regulator [Polyangiaceae bacterium]